MKTPTGDRFLGVAALAAGVGLAVWAWWLERPPAPLSLDAPAGVVSAAGARIHLERIAAKPHMPGSADHARVREYLVAELEELGFEVELQTSTWVQNRGAVVRAFTVRNILGRQRGSDSTGGVALVAHYDSQQLGAGAGDDGSGVAAILEAMRAVGESGPLRNDVYVVITDAEELGLIGARAFVEDHPWWSQITVLFNFEARGSRGQAVMFETNSENGWVVGEFGRADPQPSGSSLFYEIYQRLPNDTDFSVFKRAGVTGLNFAIAEGADVYHRTTDSLDNLSMASLQHQGMHAAAMTGHFANLDLSGATRAPDITYFRAGRLGLVRYPTSWVLPLSLLAVAAALTSAWTGVRRRQLTISGIVAGFLLAPVAAALAAAFAWGMWRSVRDFHHELGSIVGRELYAEGWYMGAIVCFCVAVAGALFALARRWFNVASLTLGAGIVPLAIAVAAALYVPGVSMLFLWPVVALLVTVAYLRRRRDAVPTWNMLGVLVLLSVPAFVLQVPLVWTLFIGLNITVAPLLAVFSVLLLALVLPLFEVAGYTDGWHRWGFTVHLLVWAFILTVLGVFAGRPGAARPIPNDLIYAMDRDARTAVWATRMDAPDPWIEDLTGTVPTPGDLTSFLPFSGGGYLTAEARLHDSPAAVARVVFDSTDGRVRSLRVEIRSSIVHELTNLHPAVSTSAVLRAVNGVPVDLPSQGAGTASPAWLLQHWGESPDGVLALDLQTEDLGGPIELVLVEFAMQFPELVLGPFPRRESLYVAHGNRLTDVSLYRQVLTAQ